MEAADFERHQQESDPHRPHWPSREALLRAAALTGVQLTDEILEDTSIVGRYTHTKEELEKKLTHLLDQFQSTGTEQASDQQASDQQAANQQTMFSMEKLVARSMRRAKQQMRLQQATTNQQATDNQWESSDPASDNP